MSNTIWLEEVGSTNAYLRSLAADEAPHATVVAAVSQTAGRGQRGNSWEAEPGKNLTFSILLRPKALPAAGQFCLSVAVSMAIVDVLRRYVPRPDSVKVKWPNDIYVGDKKICGILIENSLSGTHIAHSIVGIGLNVNQTRFLSDAPNPVSLAQLAGHQFPLPSLLAELTSEILSKLSMPSKNSENSHYSERSEISEISELSEKSEISEKSVAALFAAYHAAMWRRDDYAYPFLFRDGTIFRARVVGVQRTGHLILAPVDPAVIASIPHTFAFKEVTYLTNN